VSSPQITGEFTDQRPNATLNTTKGTHTMTAVTFDTLAFVKDLQSKGFKQEQAEGISNALKNALTVSEVATKHDIKELEVKIKELDANMKIQLAETKAEIIKWDIGAIIFAVGLSITLVKTLN
jgi:hypothetical protein